MARSTLSAVLFVAMLLTGTLATAVPAALVRDLPTEGPRDLWPGPMLGPAADKSPGRSELRLTAGTFDPVRDPLPSQRGLDGLASPGIYLVQFSKPLSVSEGAAVGASGATVLGFVPEGGLVVSMPRPSAVLAIAALPGVRWMGPWQLSWKVAPSLEGASGTLDLSVVAWGAGYDLSAGLASAGARLQDHLLDVWRVRADASRLPAIASLPGVCWVEGRSEVGFMMDAVTRVIGARQAVDGPYDDTSGAVWAYDPAVLGFPGVNGSTVTVDVTDTGVDGSHFALPFVKRKAFYAVSNQTGAWTDPMGHGTHVAGIVLGTGAYRTSETDPTLQRGKYAGVAPGALLIAQSLYGGSYWYRNLTKWSVEHNADISQNSWGLFNSTLWGNYTLDSREYDNATRDADWVTDGNQSILVVFSAGNDGLSGNSTVQTTAAGKNIITVGATGSGKEFLDPDIVWDGSSRGPTDDGRIKPDLVAPGYHIVSTWATIDDGSAGVVPGDGGTHSYIAYTGTSMAAPVVSGAAALVIDYLRTKDGNPDPSPALVKAVLIATADHLPTDAWPGKAQGWGRVNVSRALVESRTQTMEWIDQSSNLTAPGESMDYSFEVDTGSPLSVSLAWTDVSSALYTGKTLVNDLDLEVRSPSGTVWLGNVFQDNRSATGGTPDRVNNVECIYIPSPERGTWQVKVTAHELPPVPGGGSQDFAIAVSGQVNKRFVDLVAENLSVSAADSAEGETVPIKFDISNTGNIAATSVAWRLELLDSTGKLVETVRSGTVPIVLPRSSTRIFTNWTAVRGSYTVKAMPNPYRHIREESYQNNDASKAFFIKGYGLEAFVPVAIGSGAPGQDVSFDINLTNKGNTRDLYTLSRQEPPGGWSARLDRSFLDLLPGRVGTAKLIVTIPEDALAGKTASVNVTMTSSGNSTYTVTVNTQTFVEEMHALTVMLQTRQALVAPGADATFNFTLRNLGNGPDTFRVNVVQTGGPSVGVTFVLPRMTFTVPHSGEVEGTLTVALDIKKVQELPVGEAVSFSVRASSVNEPTAGAKDDGSIIIDQLHALTVLDPKPEGLVVKPGESTEFAVALANDGNGIEQVSVDLVTPPGWTWDADPATFSIEMAGTGSTTINVTASRAAEGILHNLTFRVLDKDGATILSLEVPIEVEWVQGLRVSLDSPASANVTRGSEIAFRLYVTNMGNRPDHVRLEVRGLTPGLTVRFEPAEFDAPVQERKLVLVVFNASAGAQLLQGEYEIHLRYAQDVMWAVIKVGLTVEMGPTDGDGDGDGDGGDGGGGRALLWVVLVVVVLVVVVALALLLTRSRRTSKLDEEAFFTAARGERTAQTLEAEMATEPRRRAPPPPPPAMGAGPVAEEIAPVPFRGGGARCPSCGSMMEPAGPPRGGFYCPMCGTQTGAPGQAGPDVYAKAEADAESEVVTGEDEEG